MNRTSDLPTGLRRRQPCFFPSRAKRVLQSGLNTVTQSQGGYSATYGYRPSSTVINNVAYKQGTEVRGGVATTRDAIQRISRVDTLGGATLAARRDYTYDDGNRRVQVEHEDGRRWIYGYDEKGQVNSAAKELPNEDPLPGYSFGFTFDDIGNRKTATINGREETYTPDLLNGYEHRTVSRSVDVRGTAATDATILVNDLVATRTGVDFYRAAQIDNLHHAVNAEIKVQAVRLGPPTSVATETRGVRVEPTFLTYGYDEDGNQLGHGHWSYEWDGENRLIAAEVSEAATEVVASLPKYRLEFGYDAFSRRISKTVKIRNSANTGWDIDSQVVYLYDGWNKIAELDGLNGNAVLRTYVWGMDLSGSPQGAGGVGGLLWANAASGGYAAGYDGNGNIITWLRLTDGTIAGTQEYGPFGETLAAAGISRDLPFAFSTKYKDAETQLYDYGFRYYNPSTGRWLNRDPAEEEGGVNLYAMVANDPVNYLDYLGLEALTSVPPEGTFILSLARNIQYNDEQAKRAFVPYDSSRGGYFGDGFEVEYQPAKTCPCAKQTIRLVQAIKVGRGSPGIDTSDAEFDRNAQTPGGTPLPGYTQSGGRRGRHGSTSYIDAPYNPLSGTFGGKQGTRFQFEVCALCPSGTVLGCFAFEFYNNERFPRPTGSSPAAAPGSLWNSAVERWDKASGKKEDGSIKYIQ